jgi:hypothetical protein
MTALVNGKQIIPLGGGRDESAGQKGNTVVFAGGIVMLDASGFAIKGQTITGLYAVGVAMTNRDLDRYDATAAGPLGLLADGVQTVRWDEGIFRMVNSTAGDAVLSTTIPGVPLYVVDDQTIALTNGTGTRSPAGRLHSLDADGGVWVIMGKAVGKQLLDEVQGASGVGAVLTQAANVIAPTSQIHHVAAGLIKTITVPPGMQQGGTIYLDSRRGVYHRRHEQYLSRVDCRHQ